MDRKKRKMSKQDTKRELFLRLNQAKSNLLKLGVIDKPIIRFIRKYPEFEYGKVRNYWYGKALNIDFIVKLESFVEHCRVSYE